MKIKRYKKIYPLALLWQYFSKDNFLDLLHIRRKPRVIQLPITSRCNSRCCTCNVWKLKENVDIDALKLREIFSNSYFDQVRSVGINGGEITLVQSFDEILEAVLTLKNLRNIYLISNGLLPNKLLPLLERSKKKCNEKGVHLNIAISIDGIGEVQANVRGVPHCFEKSKQLLDEFRDNQSRYADNVVIGCTLSQKNIPYVVQTDEYLKQYPFYVQYHLAVPNKRIHTYSDYDNYYILNDEHSRLLAEEFFLSKYHETRWKDCFSYFCQYYFLKTHGQKRLSMCSYKYRDITIDENLKFYLCATASDELGDGNTEPVEEIIEARRFKALEKKTLTNCDQCIHYASNNATLRGILLMLREGFRDNWDWHKKFKIRRRL